jgi:exo beta-1,2-glucooligosaccharide sophorohydrolase (non-reducing end)
MHSRLAVVAIAFTLISSIAGTAQFAYDRHVIFDNSTRNVPYYYSRASATAPSELVTQKGKLPVSTEHCVSPPNCLRLSWQSRFGGDWRVSLSVNKQWGSRDPIGNTLAFWMYSDTEVGADESPLVFLEDAKGTGTPTIRLFGSLAKLPAKERVRVRLPVSSFVGQVESTSDVKFDPAHIRTITIL